MQLLGIRGMGLTGLIAVMLLATIGCSSTTTINFNGPSGGVLTVDDKPYHLPTQVELTRPSSAGSSKRHDVALVFTSRESQEVRAKGYIDMYGYNESDVDKMSVNTCNLDEEQLVKLLNGTTVVFRGQSASRQALYDLTLMRR